MGLDSAQDAAPGGEWHKMNGKEALPGGIKISAADGRWCVAGQCGRSWEQWRGAGQAIGVPLFIAQIIPLRWAWRRGADPLTGVISGAGRMQGAKLNRRR